jgi:predicted RND superfamily exporter protein
MKRPTDWPANHPKVALAVGIVLTIASVFSMLRLRPETSIQGLLDKSQPAVAAMGRVLDDFPVTDELLLLATLPPDTGSKESLVAFAERFKNATAEDPQAKSLIAKVRYQSGPQAREYIEKVVVPNGMYYLDDQQFAEAMQRVTPAGMRRQLSQNQTVLAAPGPAAGALAKAIAHDPLRFYEFLLQRMDSLHVPTNMGSGGAFFSPDGRSLLIRIEGTQSTRDFVFAKKVMSAVQRLAKAENRDGLRIDIAGGYAIAAHSASKIRHDSILGVVSSVIGLFLLFVVLFRKPVTLFLLAFTPIGLGILWGFGVYALFDQTITPLAAVVGGALGGIGIDYAIHYLVLYFTSRPEHVDGAAAARFTSRRIVRPLAASWITSIIGFATISISPVPVLRDFALLATFCLAGAWIAQMTLLPATLTLLDKRLGANTTIRIPIAQTLRRGIERHLRLYLIAGAVIVASGISFLVVHGVHLEPETQLNSLHPEPNPPLEAQRFIASRMKTSAGPVLIYLHAKSPADLVQLSAQVQTRLSTPAVHKAGVTGLFGLASLVPDLAVVQKRQPILTAAFAKQVVDDFHKAIADSAFDPAAFAGYETFLSHLMSPGDAPDVASLIHYPEFAQLMLPRAALAGGPVSQTVTIVFFDDPLDSREARDTALAAIDNALKGMDGVTVTGMAPISAGVEASILWDLPRLLAVALAAIALFMALQFRSIKLVLMAMLPTGLSFILVLVFMSLADVRLNLVNSVMAPILVGINVYGIFATTAWRQSASRRELESQFVPLCTALITCCGTTVIGFGSLVLTSIPAIRSLGWMINIGVMGGAVATLLILWPLMLVMAPRHFADETTVSKSSSTQGA